MPEVEPGRILGHEAVGTVVDVGPGVAMVRPGALNGEVRPGDTVVVVGTGPVGLAAIAAVRLYSPSHIIVVDREPSRLEAAKLSARTCSASPTNTFPTWCARSPTEGSARTS